MTTGGCRQLLAPPHALLIMGWHRRLKAFKEADTDFFEMAAAAGLICRMAGSKARPGCRPSKKGVRIDAAPCTPRGMHCPLAGRDVLRDVEASLCPKQCELDPCVSLEAVHAEGGRMHVSTL